MFIDKNIEAYKYRKNTQSPADIEDVPTPLLSSKLPPSNTSDPSPQNSLISSTKSKTTNRRWLALMQVPSTKNINLAHPIRLSPSRIIFWIWRCSEKRGRKQRRSKLQRKHMGQCITLLIWNLYITWRKRSKRFWKSRRSRKKSKSSASASYSKRWRRNHLKIMRASRRDTTNTMIENYKKPKL